MITVFNLCKYILGCFNFKNIKLVLNTYMKNFVENTLARCLDHHVNKMSLIKLSIIFASAIEIFRKEEKLISLQNYAPLVLGYLGCLVCCRRNPFRT